MPATTTSTGSEQFATFEEKRYHVRCVACRETTSPPPDNRPQYEWQFALEGSADALTGEEIVRRTWTSQIWNETPGKESHLFILARALCGPQVTQADFDALDFPDLVGLRGSVMVKLDPKGWPVLDKETFRPVAPAKAAVAPGPRAPRQRLGLRTDQQAEALLALGLENDPPMDLAAVNAWIAGAYPGKALDTIGEAEARALIDSVEVPF